MDQNHIGSERFLDQKAPNHGYQRPGSGLGVYSEGMVHGSP